MCELNGETIAKGIKELRRIKNMTQGDVVRATGKERSYISKLEAGKIGQPRLDTLHLIAEAFEMRIDEFLEFVINLNEKES